MRSKIIKVPLTQGFYTIIDARDWKLIKDYSWHVRVCGRRRQLKYAVTAVKVKTKDGLKYRQIGMHHFILASSRDIPGDHINGDTLDNRRSNLRSVTKSQNNKNRKKPPKYKTPYKGVRQIGTTFLAIIKSDGVKHHLGMWSTAEEAAIAYNTAALTLHGEFACLNQLP